MSKKERKFSVLTVYLKQGKVLFEEEIKSINSDYDDPWISFKYWFSGRPKTSYYTFYLKDGINVIMRNEIKGFKIYTRKNNPKPKKDMNYEACCSVHAEL